VYKLPPLNALKVFEAVARLGGVRQASEELCVTPPAVSHQLAKLEEYLGAPLFIRKGRSLYLTDLARGYLAEVRPSLQSIGRATIVASKMRSRETLTVSAPPTLTSKWLLPRISNFLDEYPGYDIRLLDRMTLDPEERAVDVAIEYRFEEDPIFSSVQLMDDQIVALASPSFIKTHNINDLKDLRGHVLIETERRLNSWKNILSKFEWANEQRYLSMGYSLQAFDAAEQGVGIALGNLINAQQMIDQGRLVIPFDIDASSLGPLPRYYLTIPSQKERLARVVSFKDWLISHID